MVIIWGSKMYGKVDEIPGLCWVATRFGHLWYIPLIPMGSYVVFSEEGDGFQGADIPLSFKSLLVAWLRTGCFLAGLIGIIAGFSSGDPIAWAIGVTGAVCLIGSYFLSAITKADYRRACEIADHVGMAEELRVLLDVQYGQCGEAEAQRRLERLAAEAQRLEIEHEERKAARRAEREVKRGRLIGDEKPPKGHRVAKGVDEELRAKAPKRRRRIGADR